MQPIEQVKNSIRRTPPYRWYLAVLGQHRRYLIEKARKSNGISLLFVNGLIRSGNHFLIDCIARSSRDSVLFYNNRKHGSSYYDLSSGHKLTRRPSEKLLLLYSFENKKPGAFHSEVGQIRNEFGDAQYLECTILRDPRNWLASVITNSVFRAKITSGEMDLGLLVEIYKENFRNPRGVLVIYDSFLSRDVPALNDFLHVNQMRRVSSSSRYGGGSSFSGSKSPIQREDVLARYHSAEGDPLYIKYMDKELYAIVEEIGGIV